MSRIRGRDTKPELQLRHALHGRGLRYRLHVKSLPSKPDLVFPKHGAVVLVHGCFWHQHEGCEFARMPKSNVDYWTQKFSNNQQRDERNQTLLSEQGWRVGLVWECAIEREPFGELVDEVVAFLLSDSLTHSEWPAPS